MQPGRARGAYTYYVRTDNRRQGKINTGIQAGIHTYIHTYNHTVRTVIQGDRETETHTYGQAYIHTY